MSTGSPGSYGEKFCRKCDCIVVLVPRPCLQDRHLPAGSLSPASEAPLLDLHPAAFTPAGRSFLTTDHTRLKSQLFRKKSKKSSEKIHSHLAKFVRGLCSELFLIPRNTYSYSFRMSKSSTATAPKIPTKSAWSRGPPQSAPTPPRSQSPAPSTPVHPTHSRRPSTLGQGVPIKDGVTVPRGTVGAVKQGKCGGAPIVQSQSPY